MNKKAKPEWVRENEPRPTSTSAAGRLLRWAHLATNVVRDVTIALDARRQGQIVREARSYDAGLKELNAHRVRRDRGIVNALETAYGLLGAFAEPLPGRYLGTLLRSISRLRFANQIGTGAEGTVWKVWDEYLERTVAVKFLDGWAFDEKDEPLERARVLAQFSHPNVVTIHDVVCVPHPLTRFPTVGIVMEYLPETLEARTRRVVEAADALYLGMGLIEGVAAFHSRDIRHGDLYSRNVLVAGSTLKIIDPRASRSYGGAGSQVDDVVGLHALLCDLLNASSLPLAMVSHFKGEGGSIDDLRRAFSKTCSG